MFSLFTILLLAFLTPTSRGAPKCCTCATGVVAYSASGRCSPCGGSIKKKLPATGTCATPIQSREVAKNTCVPACKALFEAQTKPKKPKNPTCCACASGTWSYSLSGTCSKCGRRASDIKDKLKPEGECATYKSRAGFTKDCQKKCKAQFVAKAQKKKPKNPTCCECHDLKVTYSVSGKCSKCGGGESDVFERLKPDGECATYNSKAGFTKGCTKVCKAQVKAKNDAEWGDIDDDSVKAPEKKTFPKPENPCTETCSTENVCRDFLGTKACWWNKGFGTDKIYGGDIKSACCCYFTESDKCGADFDDDELLGCECQKWQENGGPGAATPGSPTTGKCWVNKVWSLTHIVWNSGSSGPFGRKGYKDHECTFARKVTTTVGGKDVTEYVYECIQKTKMRTFPNYDSTKSVFSIKGGSSCNPERDASVEVEVASAEDGDFEPRYESVEEEVASAEAEDFLPRYELVEEEVASAEAEDFLPRYESVEEEVASAEAEGFLPRYESVEVKVANAQVPDDHPASVLQWFLLGVFGAAVFTCVNTISRSDKKDVLHAQLMEDQEQL